MSGFSITSNFSIQEFSCRSGAAYPVSNIDDEDMEWLESRLLPLCLVLETLRKELGDRPITIMSGYRTEAYNRQIGGAKHSFHVQGMAADIQVDGVTPHFVYETALRLSEENKIYVGGCGEYLQWCHLDIRPWIGHLAQWFGVGIGSELV